MPNSGPAPIGVLGPNLVDVVALLTTSLPAATSNCRQLSHGLELATAALLQRRFHYVTAVTASLEQSKQHLKLIKKNAATRLF